MLRKKRPGCEYRSPWSQSWKKEGLSVCLSLRASGRQRSWLDVERVSRCANCEDERRLRVVSDWRGCSGGSPAQPRQLVNNDSLQVPRATYVRTSAASDEPVRSIRPASGTAAPRPPQGGLPLAVAAASPSPSLVAAFFVLVSHTTHSRSVCQHPRHASSLQVPDVARRPARMNAPNYTTVPVSLRWKEKEQRPKK